MLSIKKVAPPLSNIAPGRVLTGALLLGAFLATPCSPAVAQTKTHAKRTVPADQTNSGDAPDNPGPLATNLSTEITPKAVSTAMKKVADWQLATAEPKFNQLWTYAALYDGFLAAADATHDKKYRDAMVKMGQHFDWKLIQDRFPHADDQAIGQAYLDLYMKKHKPVRMADTKATMDRLVARSDDPNKLLWWWCDALFMSPPVLLRTYAITHDKKYLDYMDHEWWLTSDKLYDPQEHLYFRDERYLNRKEENGKKLFWSRGNGWVMGGLVNVLEFMPENYPSRAKYVEQFRQMAEKLAEIQSPDGLWRSGLLDPDAYSSPEVSGSAFITYGIAYGINHNILDRAKYEPVVEKAWKGMLSHIYADGRLGSIQPVAAAPDKFKPSASYVYGVGGFLLAGKEIHELAKAKH